MHIKQDAFSGADLSVFKKKLKQLEEYRGRGTELISVYVPENADRGSVMGQITAEISQSSNIKSAQTRKNVQGALRKIINFLKSIDFKIPVNGIVVFCGNVSEIEGRSDIRLFTVHPIKELKTKLYWCDSKFHLDPLKEMLAPSEMYVLLTIDKNESTIALLSGKKYEVIGHFKSNVAGKHHAGGQCLAPESLVMQPNGKIIEIKKTHNPLNLAGVDFSQNEIANSNITGKWETEKNTLLNIATKCPRFEVNCSRDHLLFSWKDGEIIEKPAEKITKGDFLVIPEKIGITGKTQKMKTSVYNSYLLSGRALKIIKNTREKKNLSQKKFGEMVGQHQALISSLERGIFCPRLKLLKKICAALDIDFENFIKKNCKPNSGLKIPHELDENVARIAGYLLGDGNIEKERLNFSEQNRDVAGYYEKLLKKTFNANTSLRFREGKNYYEIRAHGQALCRYFEDNFPKLKHGNASEIPEKIMLSKNPVVAAFLKGLFDAEGYATKRSIAIGMNNEKLMRQLQLVLLRFGIIASLHEYDNRRNPYSKRHRFTIDICDNYSINNFIEKMGFCSGKKGAIALKISKSRSATDRTRQLFVSGAEIRRLFQAAGMNTQDFPKTTNFFRNKRMMGKETFKNSVISRIKDKRLRARFEKIAEIPLIPAKVNSVRKISGRFKLVDISVKSGNFLANGLAVHNSAQRFEHLHEEAVKDFFRRTAEKINDAFLPNLDKLKGVIVGGPGLTKKYFIEQGNLDYRIKGKILGQIDTSYTDESGIRELVQRSEDLLRDTDLMQEKILVEKFFTEVAKDGLATYGQKEVEDALTAGKVSLVLLSEAIDWIVRITQCVQCGTQKKFLIKTDNDAQNVKYTCEKCGSATEDIEDVDYIDYIIEKAEQTAAEVKVVSTETAEGEQFYRAFTGIGAMLRYK